MIQNIGGFLTLAWLWSKRDKAKDEVPVEVEVSDYKLGDYCPTVGKRLSSGQICVNNTVQPLLPFTNGNGNGNGFDLNGNGNGEEPDIVGPLPVDPDEFDITTLPEYAVWDGIACAEHYTKVRVSGPYFVCKRDDLV